MAAVSATRQGARTALLAAIVLAIGLARQYAHAEGVFRAEGFVKTATARVNLWWNNLSLVDDAAPSTPPEPTISSPQIPAAVTTIPVPVQDTPPNVACRLAEPFAYGPCPQYGPPQGWPVYPHCR